MQELDYAGGESVYCINENQLRKAFWMANENPASAGRIKAFLNESESMLTRNERAALAFIIIARLLHRADSWPAPGLRCQISIADSGAFYSTPLQT